MNCKYCGKKIAKSSKFCSNCGGKVEEEVKEAVILKDIKEENKKEGSQNKEVKTNGLLISSIVVTALSLITLSKIAIIFGIIAIVFAIMYKAENNNDMADRKKYNSRIFNIIAWVIFAISFVIKIVFGIILASFITFIASKIEESDFSFDNIRNYIDNIEYYSEEIPNYYHEFMEEHNFENYSNLTKIDYYEFLRLYNSNDNSIVVITQSGCGYCKLYKPVINEIAYSYDIDIYYIDISEMSDKEYTNMTDTIDYFSEHEYWGTPTTLIVSDSKTVNYLEGYTDYEGLKYFLSQNNLLDNE